MAKVCASCGSVPLQGTRRGLCERCYNKLPDQKQNAREYRKKQREKFAAEGRCTECGGKPLPNLRRCQRCYDRHNAIVAKRRNKAKAVLAERYGKVCACCGETEPLFLSIDHINGGGGIERKELGRDQYITLSRGPVRDDLRILCHNCNRGRWLNGGECPHVTNKRALVREG